MHRVRVVTSIKMTNNLMLNKLLLSNLDLEDKIDSNQLVIDLLHEEFVNRRLSKQDFTRILYSRYNIDKHVHNYSDHTLTILAKLGLEHDKIIQIEGAYLAKYEIIAQFRYLDELQSNEPPKITFLANNRSRILRNFLVCDQAYIDVFYALDQSLCNIESSVFLSDITVTNRRDQFAHDNTYLSSSATIKHTWSGYKLTIKIPSYQTRQLSEYDMYKLKIIFDKCKSTSSGLRLTSSHLTLDRLVALVHLFFEHLD